jgi:hypothetical protein
MCIGALMNWNCNLEQTKGLQWKIGGLEAFLELFFKNQGPKQKNLEICELRVNS